MEKTYNNIISSSIATCIAEIITLPICTIKTNYQNTSNISIYETCKSIHNLSGFIGFYNSSFFALVSQILSTTIKYTLYQNFKGSKTGNLDKVISGLCAGICSSIITHPVDVLKIHYQMNASFLNEMEKYGIKIFYRGYSKTLIKTSVGSACYFPMFDIFNKYMKNSTISAFMSAIVSTTILQPFDYMKTRHIYGLKFSQQNYFKGLGLNLMRIVPHFIIVMNIIDYINRKKIF